MQVSKKSRIQYKINSAVMLTLLICAATLIAWFTKQHDRQFDWTSSGRHSLSQASIQTLNNMEGPIDITSYASENAELRELIRNMVNRYQLIKPDINLEFINQVAVPQQAAELGITVDGEMIIQYQDRREHVKSDSEEEFTNALNRLLRGTDRWLSFIEGHGERKSLGDANHDLGIWVNSINQRGFSAQPLNLTQVNAIPDNTSVLVISKPSIDFLPGEIEMIMDYVDKGGNLLWLAEPGGLDGLQPLAEKLSIEFHSGIIIDYVGQLLGSNDPTISVATTVNYQQHLALAGFDLTTLFPGAVAIDVNQSDTWNSQPIIVSGEHTWSEQSELSSEIEYDDSVDKIGPLNIAVSLSREIETEKDGEPTNVNQRILIVGDGDFLSNQFLANSGNSELGYRLINWLSNDDDFISIPAKTADDLYLELSETTKIIIILGFLILLPVMLISFGLLIWWRRKKQ